MKDQQPIPTRVGLATVGDNLFFGYSVAKDLAGVQPFSSLIGMAVAGKRLAPELAPVLDDIAAAITVADPRLWPLKAVRIVSAYGNTLPALAAGQLIFQSNLMGPLTASAAATLLVDLSTTLKDKVNDDQAVERAILEKVRSGKRLHGFGVPFRETDERLIVLQTCIKKHNRAHLPYWQLFVRLSTVLEHSAKRLHPNSSLGVAAALLDMGFAASELGVITLGLLNHVILAVAWEGAQAPAQQLRQLSVESVRYIGHAPRLSPRAQLIDQAG